MNMSPYLPSARPDRLASTHRSTQHRGTTPAAPAGMHAGIALVSHRPAPALTPAAPQDSHAVSGPAAASEHRPCAQRTSWPGSKAYDEWLAQRFPDLLMQAQDPALARTAHDECATDTRMRIPSRQIAESLISGPGSMDPDGTIKRSNFDRCLTLLRSTLQRAYEDSPTFRRLFNLARDRNLHDPSQRWLLGAGEAFGTTVTQNQIAAAGNRRVIAVNTDPLDAADTETYLSEQGEQKLDWDRSTIHEVIHALTAMPDDVGNHHVRGPVVEYTNIVLKEMGHEALARLRYAPPNAEPPGPPFLQDFELPPLEY
jgi:PipA/GogA/GtgA family effector protease